MGLSPTGTSASIAARALSSPTTYRFIPALSGLPTIQELISSVNTTAFIAGDSSIFPAQSRSGLAHFYE